MKARKQVRRAEISCLFVTIGGKRGELSGGLLAKLSKIWEFLALQILQKWKEA